MALVTKNDVTQIFAIQAPEVDLPPTFANYPRGWDTARSNNGKPTIKQFNYIQQRTDQNVLWIHQNGAALPYDAAMEYAVGVVTLKDGRFKQWNGTIWVNFGQDDSALKIVNNLSDLPNKTTARNNLEVYSKIEVDTAISSAIPSDVPNATETTAGKAKIATTAIAQAGVNDTDFITAKKLLDFIKSNVIKNDFVDVKSSRVQGVVYTNPSTSSYLNVRINAVVPVGGFIEAYVSNKLEMKTITSGGGSWGEYMFLLVPPLGTYKLVAVGTTISYWGEA